MKKQLVFLFAAIVIGASALSGLAIFSSYASLFQVSTQQEGLNQSDGNLILDGDAFRKALLNLGNRKKTSFQGGGYLHGSAEEQLINNTSICDMYLMSMLLYHTRHDAYEFQMPQKWFHQSCRNFTEYQEKRASVQACIELYAQSNTEFNNSAFSALVQTKHQLGCTLDGQKNIRQLTAQYQTAREKFCQDMKEKIKTKKSYFYEEKATYDQDCQ